MTAFEDDALPGLTVWGIFYPTDHIVAVFAQCSHAQAAHAALAAAGFAEARVWTGQDVLEVRAAYRAQRTPLERLGAHMNGQARAAAEQYHRAATLHHCFVTTQVADQDQVERAHTLLAAQNAYIIRYYAEVGTVELHQQRPSGQAIATDESQPTPQSDDPDTPHTGVDPGW